MYIDFSSPMSAVHYLEEFLNNFESDQIKAQILEIYLEDNSEVRKSLINRLGR